MNQVGVDCRFNLDGSVVVKRIFMDGEWLGVGQGRQWVDHEGRHILIMLAGDEVGELLLQGETMTWWLRQVGGGRPTMV